MPAVSRTIDSTDARSALRSAWAGLPIDLLMAAAAMALAWWGRLPDDPMSAWSARWVTGVLWLGVPQAIGAALTWRGDHRMGRLTLGLLAGSLSGALNLWALYGVDSLPRGVAAAQVWLVILLAIGWRHAVLLGSRHRRIDTSSPLMPPREQLGPIATLRKQRTLLHLMVVRDLKLKYRGSLVGFFWSLANPLVMTATYTAAFTYIFPNRVEGFIFILLIGILAWTFFAGAASMATGAIVDSGSMVKSIYFPRLILPCSTVVFNFIQYVLALVVLLPAMYTFYRLMPAWPALLMPLVMLLLAAFALGIALIMAATTAVLRDVRHLLDIALQVLFWATPILYTPSSFPLQAGAIISLSPLAPFIEAARAILYHGVLPSAHAWVLSVLYATVSLTLGLSIFGRLERRFAESV